MTPARRRACIHAPRFGLQCLTAGQRQSSEQPGADFVPCRAPLSLQKILSRQLNYLQVRVLLTRHCLHARCNFFCERALNSALIHETTFLEIKPLYKTLKRDCACQCHNLMKSISPCK
jgi:hypothetical protein